MKNRSRQRDYRAEGQAQAQNFKKPTAHNLKILRTCLVDGCNTHFYAETKFLRLCPTHRKES